MKSRNIAARLWLVLGLISFGLSLGTPGCQAEIEGDLVTEWQSGGTDVPGGSGDAGGGGDPTTSSPCNPGAALCNGVCTPLFGNTEHCGACNNACPLGSSCEGEQCACDSGVVCDGLCLADNDFNNCGDCGVSCSAGEACTGGACSCQAGLERCGSDCVVLQSNAAHCGSCFNSCDGLLCSGGMCVTECGANEQQCGQSCVNVMGNDPTNCGFCGNVCTGGRSCDGGACVCPDGGSWCNDACVDTQDDNANCGSCGNACTGGRFCSSSSCQCPGDQTWNGSSCACSGDRVWNGVACECTGGREWNGSSCQCSGGRSWNGSICECSGGRSWNGSSCECSGGRTWNGSSCQCSGGRSWNGSSCECSGGRTWNGSSCQCSGGRSWNGSSCECSGGRSWNGSSCECSGGRSWNGSSCECPSGQTWNGSSCTGSGGGGSVFSQCRFHFGTIDSYARENSGIRDQIDFFTPGWMGFASTFDQQYVCNDTANNAVLNGKIPVVVSYVAAFYSKRRGRCDCNVFTCGDSGGRPNDLCNFGAADIKQNLSAILNIYRSYAQGYADANCYGTSRPIIFEMEPDWYQYTTNSQTSPMSNAEAGSIMKQFVEAIKQYLPNAVFSMDISPWVPPNNGSDHGAQWFGNFDMSLFTFINTSGGSTEAANTRIRQSNNMTWAGVSNATGKPILADTGYGANGAPAGHDSNWDNPTHINSRMNDGVVSISQYNPNSNWGTTISNIRSQLNTPKFCP